MKNKFFMMMLSIIIAFMLFCIARSRMQNNNLVEVSDIGRRNNELYKIEFDIEFIDHNNEEKYDIIYKAINDLSEEGTNLNDKNYYNNTEGSSERMFDGSEDVQKTNINMTNKKVYDKGGKFKSYMSYKAITSKSSKQYKLQQVANTDSNGFRRIEDYYMIATGSYYGDVGDILLVELDNGNSFYAIKSDAKDNKDTDEENKVCIHDGSIVEFIVDTSNLNKMVKKMGDASYLSGFDGNVANISVVGKYEI